MLTSREKKYNSIKIHKLLPQDSVTKEAGRPSEAFNTSQIICNETSMKVTERL